MQVPAAINFGNLIPLSPMVGNYTNQVQVSTAASKGMSFSISVPDELCRKAAEIAEAQHMSADEVFASAFAGQLAEWERLKARAARGDRAKFLAVLDRAPDADPEEHDRL